MSEKQYKNNAIEQVYSSPKSDINFHDGKKSEHILVCGLGKLGQFCVKFLHEFGIPIIGIDIKNKENINWIENNIPNLLQDFLVGDCRKLDILEKAGVKQCRAVLIVTSDDSVNIKTAIAVRRVTQEVNNAVRIVVHSADKNLNDCLKEAIENFVAYNAAELPAEAIANRALGDENRGFFNLGKHRLQILKIKVENSNQHYRLCGVPLYYLYKFEKAGCLVLSHNHSEKNLPTQFHQWNPFEIIQEGDEIVYITVDKGNNTFLVNKSKKQKNTIIGKLFKLWQKTVHNLTTIWQQGKMFWLSIREQQSIPFVLLIGVIWLSLLPLGMIILMVAQNKSLDSLPDIFYATFVMLLGAYNEVLGTQYKIEIRIMNLIWMIAGIIAIAVLNSKLTEYFVSAKLRLPVNRRPIPENNHIVLIGLGRVGTQVAKFLQLWNKPFLGVNSVVPASKTFTQVPLIIDNLSSALDKVNLKEARSVVVVTDDEMVNLQLAIIAQKINPNIPVIIRTTDPTFSNDIKKLLPKAKAMCVYALSAEAFVAAALGEYILDVLRLNEQTILITEYTIKPNDTLNGLTLSEVAYGYGVVPIFYRKPNEELLMPSNNIKLEKGDSLVLLASIESLKKIEKGERLFPKYKLRVDKEKLLEARSETVNVINEISGCGVPMAATLLSSKLPQVLNCPLYEHQALILQQELKILGYDATLII